jgi:hypothetical protein
LNALAGPSNIPHNCNPSPFLDNAISNTIPPPPKSPAPEQPEPPHDEDAEMTEGDLTATAKGTVHEKVKGRNPKK